MGSILGNRVQRLEDPKFLTVGGTYVEDLPLENAAWCVYARSPYAHARITAIDVDEARSMPGVLAVFTAADVAELGMAAHNVPTFPEPMRRPYLVGDVVRHVGAAVAAVIAETRAQAADAADAIVVDYDPLPAVVGAEAGASDAVLLYPEHGTNVVTRFATPHVADFSGPDTEIVVEARIDNQRMTAAPIEPRSGAAYWTEDGRLVHYSANQGAHPTRDGLAAAFRLDKAQVRVIVPDVGGGFGAKSRSYPEEMALGFYARAVGRPIRWTETRTENMMAMPHGRAQLMRCRLGGTRDGRITAYHVDAIQDIGSHPLTGAVLPGMTMRMTTGCYEIPNASYTAVSVVTNAPSVTAFRGAGRPEAAVAIDRMVDLYAQEISMDPAEVRRINLVPRFLEPYTTGVGTNYDVGDYPEALERLLAAADYDGLRAEQARRRTAGGHVSMGIGLSTYVEITAGANPDEFGAVEVLDGGRLRVLTGATPYGQGHETTFAMIVSDRTGVPIEQIDVVHGDTDLVRFGSLTVGSRSVQIAGAAILGATTSLLERAKDAAARLLEAAIEDIVLDEDNGRFHVVGSSMPSVGWAELAADIAGRGEVLAAECDYTTKGPTFPFGAHLSVVEVDTETGEVRLVHHFAVDDAGVLINPLLADGQVHGGIAQGVAQVLYEAIVYDEDGNPRTTNFADYAVISSAELPSFELVHMSTPTWVNDLGAKGIGESGTIGSIPAVYNAVIDALAPYGITHLETPLTPNKIWSALDSRRG